MNVERCGRDWVHDRHTWTEGVDEADVHICDGGSDDVDEYEAQEHQDALADLGGEA